MTRPRGKRQGRRGRFPVTGLVLVTLFGASIAVRLAGGTAAAIAREVEEHLPESAAGSAPRAVPAPATLDPILTALERREARLEEREAELALREQDVEAARQSVEAQVRRLEAAEAELSAVLSVAETAATEDVAQLTSVYENMKPKDAAPLFEAMDPAFAAGFLARMRAEAAAQIVAGLSPQTAYSISVILAGRHVDATGE